MTSAVKNGDQQILSLHLNKQNQERPLLKINKILLRLRSRALRSVNSTVDITHVSNRYKQFVTR